MNTPNDLFTRITNASIWSEYSILELFLFFVAIVTIFYIVVFIFTSLGEHKKPPYTHTPLTLTDMETFQQSLAYTINSSVDAGGAIKTLTNGSQFLPDFLKSIENAKEYIYVTNYLWEDDEFGNAVFTALIKRAKEGIRVRVLLDGVGGHKANEKLIEELNESGGKVAYFRPIRWWNIDRWNKRSHMRNIVIDGDLGYVGGIAFTEKWLGDGTEPKSWHDFMFKVNGMFVRRLEGVFSNIWSHTTGEILPVPDGKNYDNSGEDKTHFVMLYSSPVSDASSDMEHFIWMSIMAAEKSISIENPYILPSRSIKDALMAKARAGVDVKIIGPYDTDAKHVKWASQSYYTELLSAGIKIYEYEPSRIHAKTMLIDDTWSVIGSANLDNRSSRINLELVAGTDDQVLAKTLKQKFTEDLNKTIQITEESWATHSIYLTPLRLVSRLFVRQY